MVSLVTEALDCEVSPSYCAVVFIVVDALLDKVFVQIRHDRWVEGVEQLVLIVGHDQ